MPLMEMIMPCLKNMISNSNDEHDCCSGDFKELYKQKCHTVLPMC